MAVDVFLTTYQERSVMTQAELDDTAEVVTAVQRDDDGTVLR